MELNNGKQIGDIRISIENICWFLLSVQIILDNIARNSVYFQLSLLLFIFVCSIFLLLRKSFSINGFHIIMLIFILYNLILIFLGGVAYPEHSMRMLITISQNLLIAVIIYSLLIYSEKVTKFLKVYVYSAIISNLFILFIYRDTLFSGRLAFSWREDITYNFLGNELSTTGSNAIAFYSALSIIFIIYLSYKEGFKKIYILYSLLLGFVIVLSGSRKGLLLLILGIIISLIIINKGSKKIIYGIVGMFFCIIIFYLTLTIPILYDIIGSRLEQLINLLLKGTTADSSINTRISLVALAFDLFKEQPIYGYGLDAFRVISNTDIVSDNNFLEILISSGIIGFLIYYSYVILIFVKYALIKNKSNLVKILLCIFVITLIMEYGTTTYYLRSYSLFYTLLLYGIYINYKKPKQMVNDKSKSKSQSQSQLIKV